MAVWAKCWERTVRYCAAASLIGFLASVGCSKQAATSEQAAVVPQAEKAAEPAKPTQSAEATPVVSTGAADEKHESFAKATRGGEDPPLNSNPPPDVTVSGKPVYKIYKEVLGLWDTIQFTTPDGKPIHYTAIVETDFGDIRIALRPDLAPNHVRNFVALARSGYYDGLFVDRICHEESEVEPGKMQVFDSIEAGCPLGSGDPGNGSIGYWLKPEFPTTKTPHEPGTVGACRGAEEDTAACRFYITLCDAPFLDGNFTVFGKVTQGLDVARIMAKQPTREYEEDVAGSLRPDKPIKIKKVTIQTSVGEAGR